MSRPAIQAENLSKRYRLGAMQAFSGSVRDLFQGWGGRQQPDRSSFWALKDVSFEVAQGECLGIIGRNGAGKSTLLKLLAQITEPTRGTARLRGRVGSLLEVGTGFHPELTGRENIYLNGSLLGMTRREINDQFDEIVDFSGIERFLDTPVKRYSSGMTVRLAFAVAAHLTPEILLIDEVLAVGDAQFQKRCLGKMNDVARSGRTVLFISHNMAAIESLCDRAIVLRGGELVFDGKPEQAVSQALVAPTDRSSLGVDHPKREGSGELRIVRVRLEDAYGVELAAVRSGQALRVVLDYEADTDPSELGPLMVSMMAHTTTNAPIFHHHNRLTDQMFEVTERRGQFVCTIPRLPLVPAGYTLSFFVASERTASKYVDWIPDAADLTVVPGVFYAGSELPVSRYGHQLIEADWSVQPAFQEALIEQAA